MKTCLSYLVSHLWRLRYAGIYPDVEADHRSIKKKLGEFSRQHPAFLKDIRVKAGAHKDHDAVQFIKAVINADSDKVINRATEFGAILVDLGRFSFEVIEKMNAAYRPKGVIP